MKKPARKKAPFSIAPSAAERLKTTTMRSLTFDISAETGFVQQAIRDILQKAFDKIKDSLARGEGISLKNFGRFSVKLYAPVTARNPLRPDQPDIRIPAECRVKFKSAEALAARVRKLTYSTKKREREGGYPRHKPGTKPK